MRDEIFQDCLREQASGKSRFWPELAKKWGFKNGETIRSSFKREKRKRDEFITEPAFAESVIKNKDGTFVSDKLIEMSEAEMKDDKFLLCAHGFDPEKWVITYAKSNRWHGPIDGGRQTMYQNKITVSPKKLHDLSLDDYEQLFKKKEFSLPKFSKIKYLPSDEVLELNIMDLHFGSDANHSPEKRFSKAIDDVIERIGDRKFEKIIVGLLGDIFHYDNMSRTTSAGTIVTTNSLTPYEVVDLGIDALVSNLLKLVAVAPLEVIFVPGNHDPMNGYSLVKVLEAFFKDENRIAFDCEHKSRKFRLIGNSLVGWMHGDTPKGRAMSWLQVEAAEEWGKAIYREIHSGNFHSQHGKEDGGVVLRYLPGLTDIDEWHYKKAYVGAVRAMVSFVWHKEKGLREQWFTSIVE